MRKIYKYKIDPRCGMQEIDMPFSAKILDIQNQRGDIQLWALADDEVSLTKRRIYIAMTGEPISEGCVMWNHIKTLQEHFLIIHFFDAGEIRNN